MPRLDHMRIFLIRGSIQINMTISFFFFKENCDTFPPPMCPKIYCKSKNTVFKLSKFLTKNYYFVSVNNCSLSLNVFLALNWVQSSHPKFLFEKKKYSFLSGSILPKPHVVTLDFIQKTQYRLDEITRVSFSLTKILGLNLVLDMQQRR